MIDADRRTNRTRHLLKELLLDRLKDKELDKISVTELCRLADINRSTFYLHYSDIYDLLEDIERDSLEIFDTLSDDILHCAMDPEQVIRMILQYIYEQKELLMLLLLKTKRYDFWQKIDQKVMYLFKLKVLQNYKIPDDMSRDEFDDMILFYTSGFYAIYKNG